MAEALGYVVLVSMWRGEIVKGGAGLSFESGGLVLRGPRPNKAVKQALLSIEGASQPGTEIVGEGRDRREVTLWTFPAHAHLAVQGVMRHFLVVDGVEEALSAAAKVPYEVSRTLFREDKMRRYFRVREDGAVNIVTPFNRAFVDALRLLPHSARTWTGRSWQVAAQYVDQARELVTVHYLGGAS
jgi:hypothetical protein